MAVPDLPSATLIDRVGRLMKRAPVSWHRTSGGYTMAERWIATFEDGESCFVKSGGGQIAAFLRAEFKLVYGRLHADFLPDLLAWDDDGMEPVLVLEDLSGAYWPPPWTQERIGLVLQALQALQTFNGVLTDLPAINQVELTDGWSQVRNQPEPFLRLELCSDRWLEAALPSLIEAECSAPLDGNDILHLDVRSDNLCFAPGRAILVDWNHVCRGNRDLDIAAWLPSLHSEGGPRPEDVYPLPAAFAALICGYFAARAGLPPIPQAPLVRTVQLSQLRSALPWAQRALGLPPLDGRRAPG